ncbi:hypothetical protein QTP88_012460 [Uroleucon formosanum]
MECTTLYYGLGVHRASSPELTLIGWFSLVLQKRNADFKILTWNVTSLYKTGASQNLADVLSTYDIKVEATQEIRCLGVRQLAIGEYTIVFSGMENTHHFVSERISILTINTSPINICIINGHVPIEVKDDSVKDVVYEELTETWDNITGKVIKIALGDFNAKRGREPQTSLA